MMAASAGCKKDDKSKKNDKSGEKAPKPAADTDITPKPGEQPAPPPAAKNSLADAAGTYELDPGHSVALFRVKHFGVSYVHGRFNKVTGTMVLDPDLGKTSVNIEVTADSVFTALKKRDDHLRSPDFLNSKQFPKITFTSESVRAAGEKKYEVSGELDLHGVKKPVKATFEHVGAAAHPMDPNAFLTGFEGTFTVKRSDFGMNYMQGGLGDEVVITVAVEAKRK